MLNESKAIEGITQGLGSFASAERNDYGVIEISPYLYIATSCDFAAANRSPPEEPLEIWAFRAVNAALSDLACSGCVKAFAQIDLRVPVSAFSTDVVNVGRGIALALQLSSATLTNGCNLTIERDFDFALTTAVQGLSYHKGPGRSSSNPGDFVVVIGNFGAFNRALDLKLHDAELPEEILGALLGGSPKLLLGNQLVTQRLCTSILDCNDCLSASLIELSRCSKLFFHPLEEYHKLDKISLEPLSGDLSLLVSCHPDNLEQLLFVCQDNHETATVIGTLENIPSAYTITDLEKLAHKHWTPKKEWTYPKEQMLSHFNNLERTCYAQ